MADLINCFEGTSLAAVKLKGALEKKTGTEIKLFYSWPWHSSINRPAVEVLDGEPYIDLYKIYGDAQVNALLMEYGAEKLYGSSTPYKVRNLTTEELAEITVNINIEQWFLKDITGRSYHGNITREDTLRFIDFLALFYENVIQEHSPNIIYDLDTSSVARSVLNLIAKRNNITYLSLTHSRYEDYVVVTKTLGCDVGGELLDKSNQLTSDQLTCAESIYLKFKNKSNLLNKEETRAEEARTNYNFIKFLITIYTYTKYTLRVSVSEKCLLSITRSLSPGFRCFFSPSRWSNYFYSLNMAYKKYVRAKKKKNIFNNNFQDSYFYMPFGYTVEGLSAEFSGGWLGDLVLLNVLRPCIPLNACIVAKEHRAMIPERTFAEAKKLKNMPGVLYIGLHNSDDMDVDPATLIKNSRGVICLAGTTGLEAALLGKPLLIFGTPTYNQFIGHKQACSMDDIRRFFMFPDEYIPDATQVIKYLATIKQFGIRLEYSNLFNNVPTDFEIEQIADLFCREMRLVSF